MRWAIRRWRQAQPTPIRRRPRPVAPPKVSPQALARRRGATFPWAMSLVFLALLAFFWFSTPDFSLASERSGPPALAQAQ